jgi:NDP-sugar pyrophosphorylase family protein
MKAMILAAGLGTRLQPLTNDRPKALVEINGRTLLEITIARLAAFGVTEIIVNVHHFAEMVVEYVKSKNNFGLRIEISREDDLLLDTGGGLKKAAWFFLEKPAASKTATDLDEPFLLHNVDVISDIDFREMLRFHSGQNALATLAVQARDSSRQLLFDSELQLCGRRINGQDARAAAEGRTGKSACAAPAQSLLPLAFSGTHVLSTRIFPLLNESGVFSIIDSYLHLASQGEKILAFRHDGSYWCDLGRPADLAQAAEDLRRRSSQ